MPRTWVRWSTTSSSDSRPMRSRAIRPSATWSARSRMDAALARLRPQEASSSSGAASTVPGVTDPVQRRHEAAVDGGGGPAGQLLVDDDLGQRLEAAVGPHRSTERAAGRGGRRGRPAPGPGRRGARWRHGSRVGARPDDAIGAGRSRQRGRRDSGASPPRRRRWTVRIPMTAGPARADHGSAHRRPTHHRSDMTLQGKGGHRDRRQHRHRPGGGAGPGRPGRQPSSSTTSPTRAPSTRSSSRSATSVTRWSGSRPT